MFCDKKYKKSIANLNVGIMSNKNAQRLRLVRGPQPCSTIMAARCKIIAVRRKTYVPDGKRVAFVWNETRPRLQAPQADYKQENAKLQLITQKRTSPLNLETFLFEIRLEIEGNKNQEGGGFFLSSRRIYLESECDSVRVSAFGRLTLFFSWNLLDESSEQDKSKDRSGLNDNL